MNKHEKEKKAFSSSNAEKETREGFSSENTEKEIASEKVPEKDDS